jgi:hypothetical protein
VEAEATTCPFCGVALTPQPDLRVCSGPCSGHAFPRLSRAALAAIGATLLCASCFPSGVAEYGTIIPPPADAGKQGADAGGPSDGAGRSDARAAEGGVNADGGPDGGTAKK